MEIMDISRENIVLRRAEVLTNPSAGSVLSGYVHNKVGADRIPSHVQVTMIRITHCTVI